MPSALPMHRAWLAYARTLGRRPTYEKKSPHFHSRVFRVETPDGRLAVKVVACDDPRARAMLFREHAFLGALSHPNVIRYRGHFQIGRARYVLLTDWIDGVPLHEAVPGTLASPVAAERFARACTGLIAVLAGAGIHHRDIREKNILVVGGSPVLFDFGWAAWASEREPYVPAGLALPDDSHAMRTLIQQLIEREPVGAACR